MPCSGHAGADPASRARSGLPEGTRDRYPRHDLETEPERRGKALTGELAAYRSIHAAGRFRIIYRAEAETIFIVAIGFRKDGDRDDVYAVLKRSLMRRA